MKRRADAYERLEETDSQMCPTPEEFEPLSLRIETGTRRADEDMSGRLSLVAPQAPCK